jgi:hypothetical protein
MNYTEEQPTQVQIHCTDKDQWLDAEIVTQHQHNIIMSVQKSIRLSFIQHPNKKNTWIANSNGYEFVYKQQ